MDPTPSSLIGSQRLRPVNLPGSARTPSDKTFIASDQEISGIVLRYRPGTGYINSVLAPVAMDFAVRDLKKRMYLVIETISRDPDDPVFVFKDVPDQPSIKFFVSN